MTKSNLRALVLSLLVIGSVVGSVAFVGPAAAATASMTPVSNGEMYLGGSTTMSVDVSADSSGVTDTLTMDVVDDSGSTVYSDSQSITVGANNTSTFDFAVSGADIPEAGSYTVEYSTSSSSTQAFLDVYDGLRVSTTPGTLATDNDVEPVGVTVSALPSSGVAENLTMTVINGTGSTVYSDTQTVDVGAGNSTMYSFDISSSNVSNVGTYDIELSVPGLETETTTLEVSSMPTVNIAAESYTLDPDLSETLALQWTLHGNSEGMPSGNVTVEVVDIETGDVVRSGEWYGDSVNVAPGESFTEEMIFDYNGLGPGNYSVTIGMTDYSDTATASVIIEEKDETGGAGAILPDSGSSTMLLGSFGILVAIGLIAFALREE